MATKNLNLGVVGATGMVGTEFIKILEERKTPINQLKLFSSERSAGKRIKFRNRDVFLETLGDDCFKGLDAVFFSAGSSISKIWAPKAVEQGAFAIDNSSAFRMDKEVPLIVPEVNANQLPGPTKPCLIANPNCSTIQLVVALAPLHKAFGLHSVKVSTYQSVSGAGQEAFDELKSHSISYLNNKPQDPKVFPKSICFNNLPRIGSFLETGFTDEEMKMVNESRKILGHEKLKLSVFCVRTPTLNGHSESVWVELDKKITKTDILQSLSQAPGLEIYDQGENPYPTNLEATGRDPVYIGRIHQDLEDPTTWMFWCVSDNIRKGAALNGLQIAESIFDIG